MSENKIYRIMGDGAYAVLTPGERFYSGYGFLVEQVDSKNGKVEFFSATYTPNHVKESDPIDREVFENKRKEALKFIKALIL